MKADPAFPCEQTNKAAPGSPHQGLTKREYVAALVLQGIMANPNYNFYDDASRRTDRAVFNSILFADALLEKADLSWERDRGLA